MIRRISAVYAAEKPDIVHHFTIKCVVYGSLIARRHGIRNRVNAVTGMGYVFSDEGYKARLGAFPVPFSGGPATYRPGKLDGVDLYRPQRWEAGGSGAEAFGALPASPR